MEGGMIDSTIQILKEMGANEQRDEIIRDEKIRTAKNLLKMGLPIKKISKALEIDVEEIKILKENNKSY